MKSLEFFKLNSNLFLALVALLGIGLVQVYSSSYIFAVDTYGDGLFFFKKQFLFSVLAIFVLFVTVKIPWAWIKNWGWVFWILSFVLLCMTFVPGLGVRVGGAIRWINLPFGLRFEPAELLKVTFALWFASLVHRKENFLRYMHWSVLAFLTFIPWLVLLKQPDFGTFIIIISVGYGLLYLHGLPVRYILASFVPAIPAFYYLVMNVPYRRQRMMAFLDPWADPAQIGFQVIQSMLSFHSGGLTGVGFGQGQGKLFFLPEAHTDFTLAVFGEELGFIGVLLLLTLYGFIIYKSLKISLATTDRFAKTMVLGLTMTFGLSVFINSGVVMGLLPTKGLTLPFLSYGGSSLLVVCFMFGLILNVEKTTSKNSYQ
ncbi:MAG: putative lipid II flippase FtsW [Pseudobdellovibrionaceae bacterium]